MNHSQKLFYPFTVGFPTLTKRKRRVKRRKSKEKLKREFSSPKKMLPFNVIKEQNQKHWWVQLSTRCIKEGSVILTFSGRSLNFKFFLVHCGDNGDQTAQFVQRSPNPITKKVTKSSNPSNW